jgi:imidazole glycerol phosphate synthase subunit HisF
MTADERTAIDVFLHSLRLLRLNDDGLEPGHDPEDLNAIALLCEITKAITGAGRTVEDVLLCSLADKTEALLAAAVMPGDGDVAKNWLKARGELLCCRLTGM